ncbi:MAG TPA: zinc ribbon domain-containing protein [Terriglobales bacterium]|nr:zinc ribbon domain-containing protein [Terriglobales bacterium]
MFCNQCGSPLSPGVAYCTHCGKAVGAVPVAAGAATAAAAPVAGSAVGRVGRHRNILGILWLVRGCMLLLPGMILMGMAGTSRWPLSGFWMGPMSNSMPHFLGSVMGGIGVLMLVMGGLGLATGLGLLLVQSWARMLAIVVGIVELISFPLGTALGIYTLWVLLPNEAEREYNQMAQARLGR